LPFAVDLTHQPNRLGNTTKGKAIQMAQTVANKGTRPTKAQQEETAKALTAAQQKSLDLLAESARQAMAGAESKVEALADVVTALADFKVHAARALARLSVHPAVKATRGTKAGEAAVTKMATVIGRPANTVATYWKGAQALMSKGWDKRTAAPTQAERDLVMAGFKSESARVSAYSKPATKKATKPGNKPATKGTKVTFDSLVGQLAALNESLAKYTADNGFTAEQATALVEALDSAHDSIESATAVTTK
jgi:hypothetical protein